MKVAFRADASVQIGAGHVMRCLTLADALRAQGAQTQFLCRRLPGHLGGLILAREHALAWLPDSASDAEASYAVIAAEAPHDWLVVDHYALGAEWERAQRSLVKNILAIDDLADRAHDCDLLLDQNLQEAGRYDARLPADCRLLIGPRYALLRPQFAAARRHQVARTGRVRRLLVFFGGADAGGETLKALAALELLGRNDLEVDVVIGQANPHHAAIAAACRALPGAVLQRQVEDMATLMAAADLFLGAGGGSSWERCCLGLPALVVATADNQVEQSVMLAQAGAQCYLGPAASVDIGRWARTLACVLEMPHWLIHMARQGSNLVDGKGAERVANYLLAELIDLRQATVGDSAALHAWRNHPDTRRHAFDPAEIACETHERWLAKVLADPDCELLIAESGGAAVGVLRFDISAGRTLVSIYLVPGLAGQGWGVRLLLAGENWLRRQRADVRVLEADVSAGNLASSRAFQAAGFVPSQSRFRKDVHGSH
ncbi:MAG: UDP-2,4-diacetamido-2,4,6-trideoxy-beta-L-altropyranose hydrolase [Pseudomonadota bacterium]|nr:UDP-2,4-diacetamido-2,4,6-trideoxy-beta-L-altropyranose hydrolase [Pseudomonadota bacterium]